MLAHWPQFLRLQNLLMENTSSQFDIKITVEEDFLLISASGNYSLLKANNLFKLSIDNGLSYNKSKILIDVSNITGSIPFFDRFKFAEFLSSYRTKHALEKVHRIAVVGKEPIVDKERFGEKVAKNRGTNVRVFTDMTEASIWINNK